MKCIVPLAGPDLIGPYGIKPFFEVDGEPLIRRAITSRAWWRSGRMTSSDLVFVLRDVEVAGHIRERLSLWFPGAGFVLVNRPTGGALLSALAGAAIVQIDDRPLLIDLVDILFDMDDGVIDRLAEPHVGAVVPWFHSEQPSFSYLELGANGTIARTREKQVISNLASAGAYFFANLATFLEAASFTLKHAQTLAYRGVHFICPSINGVIAQGKRALPAEITNVVSLSSYFHLAYETSMQRD